MSKTAAASILPLLILVMLGLGPACAREEGADSGGDPAPQESDEERERRAEQLLEGYGRAVYDEKIRGLTEVAHIYWDTPSGPRAARGLIFYLLDGPRDDPETALEELKRLHRRRPEHEDVMTAAVVFTYALQKRLLDRERPDAKRELRQRLFEEGMRLRTEIAEDLCNRPEYADRYDMHLEWGNGYLMMREFEKAEAAWARVDSFDPPPEPFLCYRLLIKRANNQRENLGDDARSLELFERALAIQEKLSEDVGEGVRDHVTEAIADLRKRLGR